MEKNEILLKKQTEFEIFLLSLKDAIKCTKQISDVNFTRENLNRVITDFNKIIAYKNIFSYHIGKLI